MLIQASGCVPAPLGLCHATAVEHIVGAGSHGQVPTSPDCNALADRFGGAGVSVCPRTTATPLSARGAGRSPFRRTGGGVPVGFGGCGSPPRRPHHLGTPLPHVGLVATDALWCRGRRDRCTPSQPGGTGSGGQRDSASKGSGISLALHALVAHSPSEIRRWSARDRWRADLGTGGTHRSDGGRRGRGGSMSALASGRP